MKKRIVENQLLPEDFKKIKLSDLKLPINSTKDALEFLKNIDYKKNGKNYSNQNFSIKDRNNIEKVRIDTIQYTKGNNNIIFRNNKLRTLEIEDENKITKYTFKKDYIDSIRFSNIFDGKILSNNLDKPSDIYFDENGISTSYDFYTQGIILNFNGPARVYFNNNGTSEFFYYTLFSSYSSLFDGKKRYYKLMKAAIKGFFNIEVYNDIQLLEIYCFAKYFKNKNAANRIENYFFTKQLEGNIKTKILDKFKIAEDIMKLY